MRLSQLRFLVELKKHKTISETAQKLYISQPSLSTAIKELEEELGFDIIERSNKGVKFTKRGELVLKYSRDVMQSVNGIERLSKNKEHSHKNFITIASIYYIFQSVVMESFLDFKERYPDVQVSLREENSYDIVQMLINEEIDLGIIMISSIEELTIQQTFEQHNIDFYKLMDEEMCFVVGPKNPLYGKENATMQELLQFPFLTRRNMLNKFNETMLRYYNKNMEFIQIDEGDSFLRYLSRSLSVSVMPRCSVKYAQQTLGLDLHILHADDFKWTSKIGWIYPRTELFSEEEEAFVGLLEEKSLEYDLNL